MHEDTNANDKHVHGKCKTLLILYNSPTPKHVFFKQTVTVATWTTKTAIIMVAKDWGDGLQRIGHTVTTANIRFACVYRFSWQSGQLILKDGCNT